MYRSMISLSKIAHQMWHNHPLSHRNKATEQWEWGVGGNREKGGGTKFENEYLVILPDEHLQWKKLLAHVQVKSDHGIGILRQNTRHNTNLKTFKIVYHSFFVISSIWCPIVGSSK